MPSLCYDRYALKIGPVVLYFQVFFSSLILSYRVHNYFVNESLTDPYIIVRYVTIQSGSGKKPFLIVFLFFKPIIDDIYQSFYNFIPERVAYCLLSSLQKLIPTNIYQDTAQAYNFSRNWSVHNATNQKLYHVDRHCTIPLIRCVVIKLVVVQKKK